MPDTKPPIFRAIETPTPLAETPTVIRYALRDSVTNEAGQMIKATSVTYNLAGGTAKTVKGTFYGADLFRATIPAQAAGAVVTVKISATDRAGNVGYFAAVLLTRCRRPCRLRWSIGGGGGSGGAAAAGGTGGASGGTGGATCWQSVVRAPAAAARARGRPARAKPGSTAEGGEAGESQRRRWRPASAGPARAPAASRAARRARARASAAAAKPASPPARWRQGPLRNRRRRRL